MTLDLISEGNHGPLNRVTGKAWSWKNCQNGQLPQGTAVVSYSYDQNTNGIGHLTHLTDQAGSADYSYDALGRMSSESRTINGVTKTLSYTYNLDGSPKPNPAPKAQRVPSAPKPPAKPNLIRYRNGSIYERQ